MVLVGSWTLSGPTVEVEVKAAAIVELARVPKVPPAWVHPTVALGFQRPDTGKQRELGEGDKVKFQVRWTILRPRPSHGGV
jgi:hypothetical protein